MAIKDLSLTDALLKSNQFLKFIAVYIAKFKRTNGFGRWLAEYDQMEALGLFKPNNLRAFYCKILVSPANTPYIHREAAHYICVPALDATRAFFAAYSFDIKSGSGEIIEDINRKKLEDLTFQEAIFFYNELRKEGKALNINNIYLHNTNKSI